VGEFAGADLVGPLRDGHRADAREVGLGVRSAA